MRRAPRCPALKAQRALFTPRAAGRRPSPPPSEGGDGRAGGSFVKDSINTVLHPRPVRARFRGGVCPPGAARCALQRPVAVPLQLRAGAGGGSSRPPSNTAESDPSGFRLGAPVCGAGVGGVTRPGPPPPVQYTFLFGLLWYIRRRGGRAACAGPGLTPRRPGCWPRNQARHLPRQCASVPPAPPARARPPSAHPASAAV